VAYMAENGKVIASIGPLHHQVRWSRAPPSILLCNAARIIRACRLLQFPSHDANSPPHLSRSRCFPAETNIW
jgi:hypothetical protein